MAERVVIMSADCYSIPDEKTGVINEIRQMYFFNHYRERTESGVGSKPMKTPITRETYDQIMKDAEVPAVYDIDYGTRPGAQGKPSVMVTKVTFVKPLNVPDLLDIAPAPMTKAVPKDGDKKAA